MFRRVLLLMTILTLVFATGFREGVLAKALSVEGIVSYRNANAPYWEEVKPGTEFKDYDELQTSSDSSCVIYFKEGHIVHIDPSSKLTLQGTKKGRHKGLWQHMRVSVGKVWVKLVKGTNEKEQLLIETPFLSVSKKNVLFSVSAPTGKISAFEGNVEVMNGKKKVIVAEGFESDVNETGDMQDSQPLSNEALQAFDSFANHATGMRKETLERVLKRLRSQSFESVRVVSENGRYYSIKQEDEEKPKGFFAKILDFIAGLFY